MSFTITELKSERRKLENDQRDVQRKLEAINRAIEVYSPKTNTGGDRKNAVRFNFKDEARRIFEERNNKPMKMGDLIKKVLENHPELTNKQIVSKVSYAKREDSGILEKIGYGMYKFKGLSPQDDGWVEEKGEQDESTAQ